MESSPLNVLTVVNDLLDGILQVKLFMVLRSNLSVKKTPCSKDFSGNLKDIFNEGNCNSNCNGNCNSYKFSYTFAFILLFYFHEKQKQESIF